MNEAPSPKIDVSYINKLKVQKQESIDDFDDFLEDEGLSKPQASFKYTVHAPETI